MPLNPGTRIKISYEGEGWLNDAPDRDLIGTVRATIAAKASFWYVVQLDTTVEIQESGGKTASGFHLVRYTHALIGSRWEGAELADVEPVSCYVSLVHEGESLPADQE